MIKNKLVKFITSFICIVVMLSPIVLQKDIFAAPPDQGFNQNSNYDSNRDDIFVGEDNSLNIMTNDKAKTSDIYYKTEGFTITEMDMNGNIIGVIPFVNIHNPVSVNHNGRQSNVFNITAQELITYAAIYSPATAQRIAAAFNGTGQCNIRIDSVMQVYHGNTPQGVLYGNVAGMFASMADLINAENWANKGGIPTHFNWQLVLNPYYGTLIPGEGELPGEGEGDEPDRPTGMPASDQHVTLDYTYDHDRGASGDAKSAVGLGNPTCNGENQPFFATGNDSNIYNLGRGIPSKEYVENEVRYDNWHAYADVWGRVCVADYVYWVTWMWEEDHSFTDSEGVYHERKVTYSQEGTVGGTAAAGFEYLMYASVEKFSNAKVFTGAINSSGTAFDYSSTGGEIGATSTNSVLAVPGNHVRFPDKDEVKPCNSVEWVTDPNQIPAKTMEYEGVLGNNLKLVHSELVFLFWHYCG